MSDWNVVARLRIMPDDIEVDLDGIDKKIRELVGEKAEVHSSEVKPIAFGLSALEVNILLNDKQGGMDELQDKINDIDGVSEAEVTDLNRL